MTREQLKQLIKEEIRLQIGEDVSDEMAEGMLDRMKAKAKGAVSGVKGAAGAAKDKVMGKGEKGQSMKDAMKQGAKGGKEKAVAKQITGTYLKKIGKELADVHNDFSKLGGIEGKTFEDFVMNLSNEDLDSAKLFDNIFKLSKSLKKQLSKGTE